jgi:predicted YcjX-like family ATPase
MRELTLDIVDYPGEWLLDLPLLRTSYEDWSAETIRLSPARSRQACGKLARKVAMLDGSVPK